MVSLQLNDVAALQHFELVKELLKERTRRILNNGINRNGRRIRLGAFGGYLERNLLNDNFLKELIIAKPEELIEIIEMYRRDYPHFFIKRSDQNFIIKNIFIDHCYNDDRFSKHNFIKSIAVDTCPYCNRSYIYYLSEDLQIKPQIDHFYPQSIYPFLGVSFYNLIPSCQTCNGFGAKEGKDSFELGLKNPYLIKSNDFEFTYLVATSNFLNNVIDKDSVLVLFSKQIDIHVEMFKLDKLYKQHSDHVIELIFKSKIQYSRAYREYLRRNFPGVTLNDYFINRMILGNYSSENETHKRPLAKLYQDIGKKLSLI